MRMRGSLLMVCYCSWPMREGEVDDAQMGTGEHRVRGKIKLSEFSAQGRGLGWSKLRALSGGLSG